VGDHQDQGNVVASDQIPDRRTISPAMGCIDIIIGGENDIGRGRARHARQMPASPAFGRRFVDRRCHRTGVRIAPNDKRDRAAARRTQLAKLAGAHVLSRWSAIAAIPKEHIDANETARKAWNTTIVKHDWQDC
jgi:hypothetical protein